MPGPLTTAQIDFFKAHGYLVLPGLVEPVYLQEWRRRFWTALGEDEHDRSTWKNQSYQLRDFCLQPEGIRLDAHPKMRAIVQQLGGGAFEGGGAGAPLVHWPQTTTAWEPTRWGHLDGYYPGNWTPFMFAATVYAYDCEPMGGGFQYWPDSHLSTHRYFLENPEQVDGRFRDQPGFNWGGPNEFTRRAPLPPRTFDATAGDVILWHAYTVHTGSANIRTTPRVAFFARYHHRDCNVPAFKYEIPENLWKYWAV